MLALGLFLGIWDASVLLVNGGSQIIAFQAAAGWFVLLAIGYLGLHGLKGLAWCSVLVLLTFRSIIELVVIPVVRFASGADTIDSIYIQAMVMALIGFIGFWIGSLVFVKRVKLRFVPQEQNTSKRIGNISVAMLTLGVGGNLILWKTGLFAYTADSSLRESNMAITQWLGFLANLLNAALVVSAIEIFGKRGAAQLIKAVFYLSIILSIGFGVISGTKGATLTPILYVILVYGVTKGKIPRMAILLPLSLVLIYPFINAYRGNLNSGYRDQINTSAGLGATIEKTFNDVIEDPTSKSEVAGNSIDKATDRLSVLTYIHDVIGLPDPSILNGDEKLWLAPFYPLVPRFLWKEKPVDLKGKRLSIALGIPATSSTAVTPIGDLYSLYGKYGVVIGMFIWGVGLQLYQNWIGRGNLSERRLFIYILMLTQLINLESDVFSLVAGTVQLGITVIIMSSVIYYRPVPMRRLLRNYSFNKAS